jgi:hypothetical protein
MKTFFRLAIAAAACLALASCADLKSAYTAVTTSDVSPKLVVIAGNAFDLAEVTATGYIKYCTPVPQPAGCDDAAIHKIIPAVKSGRVARNTLEQFLVDHPGELGPKGLYDALVSATATIKAITANYKGN